MENVPDVEEIASLLGRLAGADYTAVRNGMDLVRRGFERVDQEGREMLDLDHVALRHLLAPNATVFSDHEPAEGSVFVYFDLSTSVTLLRYITEVRTVIRACLGIDSDAARFSDVRLQHSTLFIDMLATPLRTDDALVPRVRSKYEQFCKALPPFTLWVKGPHLGKGGGVILECAVASDVPFRLHYFARDNDLYVVQGARRGIHDILHSTLCYVPNATPSQIAELYYQLGVIRRCSVSIPIRVREARVIATRNRRLIGSSERMVFGGLRHTAVAEHDMLAAMSRLADLLPTWIDDELLRGCIIEEALYWSEEATSSALVLRASSQLLKHCLCVTDGNIMTPRNTEQ